MANITANLVDWWVDKLNKLHLVPTNAATMLRDIASKQLSDGNFTPRPLTADNFTDAELDAIHRLAYARDGKTAKTITPVSYFNVADQAGQNFEYGSTRLGLGKYLSPLRVISTTLGQAGVEPKGEDNIVRDTYDFNTNKFKYYDLGNGKAFILGERNDDGTPKEFDSEMFSDPELLAKYMKQYPRLFYTAGRDNAYSRMRDNMSGFGHKDIDPDSQKIKTSISLNDIEKRLGDRLGTFDVTKPISKNEFIWKSIGAGALTGAPIGAALGAVSGAILMLDKKRRKKWFKTMLTHIALGSAIAAALGGSVGGVASSKAWNRFEKKSAASGNPKGNGRGRSDRIRSALITALAYAAPLAALAAVGSYAKKKMNVIEEKLTQPMDITNTNAAVPMTDDEFDDFVSGE